MRSGIIARKIGMTRVFNDAGHHVPVTVVKLDDVQVVAVRDKAKDGYTAVQLGAGAAKAKNISKPMRGHFAKANVLPKSKLAEFRVQEDAVLDVGAKLAPSHFVAGQKVDVARYHSGQRFCRRYGSVTILLGLGPRMECQYLIGRTVQPVSAKIQAKCSRVRKWPVRWGQYAALRRT